MKIRVFMFLCIAGLMLCCGGRAFALDELPPSMDLATAAQASAGPAAAMGHWTYMLVSGELELGTMDISVEAAAPDAAQMLRMEQSGEFMISATESQRITSTALLRASDLALLEYSKTEEDVQEGRAVQRRTTTSQIGALTIDTTIESPGAAPLKNSLKKYGPVHLAPAAVWVFLHTMELVPERSYAFDAFLPEPGQILEGRITVRGPVSRKRDGAPETLLLISASNGLDVMNYYMDPDGRIVEYGPESGEIVLRLKQE